MRSLVLSGRDKLAINVKIKFIRLRVNPRLTLV